MSAPFSVREAHVALFGVDVVVHHLNTGERVIEEGSMIQLIEAMSRASDPVSHADLTDALAEILG